LLGGIPQCGRFGKEGYGLSLWRGENVPVEVAGQQRPRSSEQGGNRQGWHVGACLTALTPPPSCEVCCSQLGGTKGEDQIPMGPTGKLPVTASQGVTTSRGGVSKEACTPRGPKTTAVNSARVRGY